MSEIHGDILLAFGASCCQVSKVHQQMMSKNRTSVKVNPRPTNRCGYCGNGILLNICILNVKRSEPGSVYTPFWLGVVHIHQTTQSICLSQSGICISSRSKVHQCIASTNNQKIWGLLSWQAVKTCWCTAAVSLKVISMLLPWEVNLVPHTELCCLCCCSIRPHADWRH